MCVLDRTGFEASAYILLVLVFDRFGNTDAIVKLREFSSEAADRFDMTFCCVKMFSDADAIAIVTIVCGYSCKLHLFVSFL